LEKENFIFGARKITTFCLSTILVLDTDRSTCANFFINHCEDEFVFPLMPSLLLLAFPLIFFLFLPFCYLPFFQPLYPVTGSRDRCDLLQSSKVQCASFGRHKMYRK